MWLLFATYRDLRLLRLLSIFLKLVFIWSVLFIHKPLCVSDIIESDTLHEYDIWIGKLTTKQSSFPHLSSDNCIGQLSLKSIMYKIFGILGSYLLWSNHLWWCNQTFAAKSYFLNCYHTHNIFKCYKWSLLVLSLPWNKWGRDDWSGKELFQSACQRLLGFLKNLSHFSF